MKTNIRIKDLESLREEFEQLQTGGSTVPEKEKAGYLSKIRLALKRSGEGSGKIPDYVVRQLLDV